MRHSKVFWVALISCLITGIIGLAEKRPVIYISYLLIDPILFYSLTSLKILRPVRKRAEKIGALILFLNIPGSLYLHNLGIQYDVPLHFFIGMLGLQAAALILPFISKIKFSKLAMIGMVFLGGLIFEGVQNLSDILFGTNLATDMTQSKPFDFLIDILMNTLGAAVAAIFSKPASSQSEPASPNRAE